MHGTRDSLNAQFRVGVKNEDSEFPVLAGKTVVLQFKLVTAFNESSQRTEKSAEITYASGKNLDDALTYLVNYLKKHEDKALTIWSNSENCELRQVLFDSGFKKPDRLCKSSLVLSLDLKT